MNIPYILRRVAELIETRPDGFTISSDMTEEPVTGYAVAITQDCFDLEGLGRVITEVGKNQTLFIGGWLNPDNDQFYFDAVKVVDTLAEAKHIGGQTGQLAIYDLANQITIEL